jgi:adenine-specific DNA glycosylase
MSRRPTRQLTLPFVLRTFARLRMIASRYDAEWLVKELAPYREQIEFPAQFAADMIDYWRKVERPKHPDCAQCGEEILLDHNGARYCSTSCRQRAWRERKAKAEGRNSPIPKRVRTQTIALAGGVFELHLKKPPRDVSNSAHAQRNVSETPQSDTSPHADGDTNVTQASP